MFREEPNVPRFVTVIIKEGADRADIILSYQPQENFSSRVNDVRAVSPESVCLYRPHGCP